MAPQGIGSDPLADHEKYMKVKDLASGAFGFVQLARNRATGRHVAIKFLPRGERIGRYVERELVNHSNFCHPHVIQFKEAFLTRSHLGIAMEYAPGGDLFSYVSSRGGLSEDDARFFFQQLVMGLDYCHRMGVANRDIKLENTLLDGSKPRPLVKLCDFGYSKHIDDSRPKTKVGTPGYTAPEVVRAAASSTYDGPAADVWSAGVMLYTMVFCAYPFERPGDGEPGGKNAQNVQTVLERILKVEYEFPTRKPVSDELKDLISKILVADPKQRATLAEVSAHRWFRHGLPAGAASMNDACLALRPHEHPGYQTVEAIRAVVSAAARRDQREGEDDAIIEDALDDESGGGGGGGRTGTTTTTTTSGSGLGSGSGGGGRSGSGGGGGDGGGGEAGGGDGGGGARNGSSEGTLALDSEGPGRRSSFLEV